MLEADKKGEIMVPEQRIKKWIFAFMVVTFKSNSRGKKWVMFTVQLSLAQPITSLTIHDT